MASVMLLAIAVPPTLQMLISAGADRADSVQTTRAALFAGLLAETVIADAASTSPGLGFDAFDDPAAYTETALIGLRARIQTISEPYEAVGMSWTIDIGPATHPDGSISVNPGDNVVRAVTIRVRFPSATGDDRVMPVALIVGRI